MSKDLSRRSFLKGIAAGAAGMAAMSVFPISAMADESASEGGIYTPGTYSASARGMESEVTVTMTFDANSITDVTIDVSGETQGIGAAIGDKMAEAIMTAQSSEIDAVSGASVTSEAIRTAAADCISQASGGAIAPPVKEEAKANTDWLGEEPQIEESSIKETIDTEVLVVGCGHGGIFAAAAAVEEGAKTILIERFNHDMASGIRDTLAACDSSEQKEDGDNVDKNEAIQYLCDWSQGYTRRSLAKVWADNSGEAMDWYRARLQEGGMDFRHEIDEPLQANYKVLDVGHSVQYGEEYYEQLTMDKVLDYAVPLGLDVQYEKTMIKLEKDGDRVTGVIAKDAEDNYIRYNASKGVIIATGGYSGNEEMIRALQPQTIEQTCVNYSKPGSKGDGIKACLWAGAIMDTVHTAMIFDRGAVPPDYVGETGKSSNGMLFWMGTQPFLKVNLNGERFMSESQPYDYTLHQAAQQPGHTYVTVWGSDCKDQIEQFETHGCSRMFAHKNGTAPVFEYDFQDMIYTQPIREAGWIVESDTIEGLAEGLNIPVETFTKTVERYNELCAKGVDEDFGKESFRMLPLDKPPFCGVRQCGGYLICTMDGIQITDTMHAMDAQGNGIPGLYVVGDCSGNYFAGSYPNLMAGAAAGRTTTFGRLAGKNAAAEI